MANKQSSPEMSALASRILRRRPIKDAMVLRSTYNLLLEDAQKLAGSVMSQDEESAGG